MSTKQILGPEFFDRPTLVVARELLGKYLVRRMDGNPSTGLRAREIALMIMETEAYDGHKDKASHASRGQTPRNTPMFGQACTIYMYFTYGMHWMLNIVCGKAGYPAAVLIRGLQSEGKVFCTLDGSATTLRSGEMNTTSTPPRRVVASLLNGPAKLTKFLKIDKSLNNKPLGPKTGLWIEDRGVKVLPRHIQRTPRIGVAYAGEYAKKRWRFVLKTSKK